MKEDLWLAQIRHGIVPSFPRDIHLTRKKAYTEDHYRTISRLNHASPDHTAVYSDWEIKNHTASCIFFDVDQGGGFYDNLSFLTKNWPTLHRLDAFILWTGNDGFHVYIPLVPIIVDLMVATKFVMQLLGNGVDVDNYIDKQPLGDWRKMGRLPMTIHEESGRYSMPYYGSDFKFMEKNGFSELTVELSTLLLKYKPLNKRLPSSIYPLPDDVEKTGTGPPPPCILSLLDRAKTTRHLSHVERIHLASFMMRIMDLKDVVDIFKLCADFSYKVTSYQVKYLHDRGIRSYSCEKAKEYGICPMPLEQEKCPSFPSINQKWA